MTALWVVQGVAVLAVALAIAWPLGRHMARVFAGERTALHPALAPLQRAVYRLAGVQPGEEMPWPHSARAVVAFGPVSTLDKLARTGSFIAKRLLDPEGVYRPPPGARGKSGPPRRA